MHYFSCLSLPVDISSVGIAIKCFQSRTLLELANFLKMFYESVFFSHFLDQVANSNEKDSWEDADNSANNTPATTPEEEENSIDNDSTYVPASKPRTKVRPEVKEATTTEKEHVNVVFIGHVGK